MIHGEVNDDGPCATVRLNLVPRFSSRYGSPESTMTSRTFITSHVSRE